MFNLPDKSNTADPQAGKKAQKMGLGGSLVILVIWIVAIADTRHGGVMKPIGHLLITVVVLFVSGIACIGIALGQFVDAKTRRDSFLSLFYGLLPIITFAIILGFIRYIMNIEFS